MDYAGQALCEQLNQIINVVAGVRPPDDTTACGATDTTACARDESLRVYLTHPYCIPVSSVWQLIGFGYGWYVQSFWLTFLWCVGGLVVSSLVCIPDWPFFNRHPLGWQAAEPVVGSGADQQPDTNELCGTCLCGANIHGIHCESHPEKKEKKPDATSEAAAAPGPATVEIQEIKVRSSKKK
jgi:hypothetical protein